MPVEQLKFLHGETLRLNEVRGGDGGRATNLHDEQGFFLKRVGEVCQIK